MEPSTSHRKGGGEAYLPGCGGKIGTKISKYFNTTKIYLSFSTLCVIVLELVQNVLMADANYLQCKDKFLVPDKCQRKSQFVQALLVGK